MTLVRRRSVIVLGLASLLVAGCGGGERVGPTEPSGFVDQPPATAIHLSGPVDSSSAGDLIGRFDPPSTVEAAHRIANPALVRPGPPNNLRASVGIGFVTLTWDPPASGGPASTYWIEVASQQNGRADLANFDTRSAATSFSARAPNGTYHVRVKAENDAGKSEASNEVVVLVGPCATPPGQPLDLTHTVKDSTVTLTWRAPPLGPAPTSYKIEVGSQPRTPNIAILDTGSTATSYAVRAPAGRYWVQVRAKNACGESDPSNDVEVVVGGVPPGAPTNLAASVVDVFVTRLTWKAPTSGGTPTTYIVEIGSSPGASDKHIINTGSTATEISVRLSAGTFYARVKAANAVGTGPPSNEVNFVFGLSPAAPTNLSASIVDVGIVRLTWTAATSGGPPTTYFVEIGSSPGATDVHVVNTGSTATEISIRLSAGTYYARVKAANAFGTSPASNEVTFVVALQPGGLDGTWNGQTGQGERLWFTVSGGAMRRLDFFGKAGPYPSPCSVSFWATATVNQPILNNSFAFSGRADFPVQEVSYQISGSFASARASSGSLRFDYLYPAGGGCPATTYTVQTTWSASK